ncbi:hypothetical protein ABZX39_31375 [Streptomyces collinus]
MKRTQCGLLRLLAASVEELLAAKSTPPIRSPDDLAADTFE